MKKKPISERVLSLYKSLDDHINTESSITNLNICSKQLLNSSVSINQKYLKEPGSNAITTEVNEPKTKSSCNCINASVFTKTTATVGSLMMEELKLNISQYETVKTYSSLFLIGMEDVNSIIYTIGCLSKLIPENNGKSCATCGDCTIFAKTPNVLPYEESLNAISPMMAKMAKLESLIGKIPSEILKNYKMVKCFMGELMAAYYCGIINNFNTSK
ncbi:hypothetical protein ACTFIW_012716 [Dictyostelium discoideum]